MLFEAARRLPEMLADCADRLGAREAAVCRELTKLHEEAARGSCAQLLERYEQAPRA